MAAFATELASHHDQEEGGSFPAIEIVRFCVDPQADDVEAFVQGVAACLDARLRSKIFDDGGNGCLVFAAVVSDEVLRDTVEGVAAEIWPAPIVKI